MRWLLALLLMLAALPAQALPGRLVRHPAMTAVGLAPRDVTVWLPDGYDRDRHRYAVLYMHDARNLFDPATAMGGHTWGVAEALSRLIAEGKTRRTIIVGIDNTPARSREYMPAKVFAALPPAERAQLAAGIGGEPQSDAYLRFIVRELKPSIDRTYRTDPRRGATFIMGSSMGGLISLYALTEYPKVFGGAGCLSTHWPLPLFTADNSAPALPFEPVIAAFTTYLGPRLPASGRARLWFDHGDQGLDAHYAPYQQRIDALLAGRHLRSGQDYLSHIFPGATHNEPSWAARIDQPLAFLLGPR